MSDHASLLEPQIPAEGISAMSGSFANMKMFRIPCRCGCDAEMIVSIELDDDVISTHIYQTTKTNVWRDCFPFGYRDDIWLLYVFKNFVNDWYNRLAVASAAVFRGYITTESYAILSEQQTVNFAATLNRVAGEFAERQAKELAARQAKKDTDVTS